MPNQLRNRADRAARQHPAPPNVRENTGNIYERLAEADTPSNDREQPVALEDDDPFNVPSTVGASEDLGRAFQDLRYGQYQAPNIRLRANDDRAPEARGGRGAVIGSSGLSEWNRGMPLNPANTSRVNQGTWRTGRPTHIDQFKNRRKVPFERRTWCSDLASLRSGDSLARPR